MREVLRNHSDNSLDHFSHVFNSTGSQVLLGSGFFLTEILGNSLLCGIIYHQCVILDRRRTIINCLNGFSVAVAVFYSLVNMNAFFVRTLFGPLSECVSSFGTYTIANLTTFDHMKNGDHVCFALQILL